MSTISIQIFGNPVAFAPDSLHFTAPIGNQRGTCDFVMDDIDGNYVPKVGQLVEVFEDSVLRYSGTLDEITPNITESAAKIWEIACTDFNAFADRHAARPRAWTDTEVGQIFKDLAETDGVTDEGVDATTYVTIDPMIRADFEIKGDYPACGSVFDDLAKLASSISGIQHRWYIDLEYRAHFGPLVTQSPELRFDRNNIRSAVPPRLTITREQFASRVILVLANSIGAAVTETFNASDPDQPVDGSRTSWNVTKPLAAAPTVAIDNTASSPAGEVEQQSVGILGVDTGKQWYWAEGSSTITQDTGDTPLASPQSILITYRGQQENVIIKEDAAAIAARQADEGGSGIYEAVLTFSDFATVADGEAMCQAELDRRKELSVVFRFQTMETAVIVGQNIYLDIPEYDYGGVFVASGEYFVRSVGISDDKGVLLWREVEAVRGPIVMDSLEFFRSLLGRGTSTGITAASTPGDKATFNWDKPHVGDLSNIFTVKIPGRPRVANATAVVPSPTGTVYINARYSRDNGLTWSGWLLTDDAAHRLAIPQDTVVSQQREEADFEDVELMVNDLVQGKIMAGSAEDAEQVNAVFAWV